MKNFLLLLYAIPFLAEAQRQVPVTAVSNTVVFSPLALLQSDFTALGGYEHRLSPKIFLLGEAGYIFASNYISSADNSSASGTGFLLRPALKWFASGNGRFYLQPQVFYKQVTHNIYDWLGKDVVDGVPSYEQLQHFKYRRKIAGFNGIAGFVLPLEGFRRGYIDLYFGLGVRRKSNEIAGEPRSVYFVAGVFTSNKTNEGWFPSVPMGARFVYALN